MVTSADRVAAYDRVIQLFLSGDMSADLFVRVFMALWGVLSPPFRGASSRSLHEIFSYLDALEFPTLLDDEVRDRVRGLWVSGKRA